MTGVIMLASTALVSLIVLRKNGKIVCGAMKLLSAGFDNVMSSLITSLVSMAAGDFTVVTIVSGWALVGMDSARGLAALLEVPKVAAGEIPGSRTEAAPSLRGMAGTG